MISLALLLTLAVSSPNGQLRLPLAGFRYIKVVAVEVRVTGNPDPAAQGQYLESLLAKQGWSVVSGSENLLQPEQRATASQMIQCRLAINDDGWGTGAILSCTDVLGTPVVETTGRGVAVTAGGEMRAAIRKVAEQLQMARPRFDPAQTVDLLSRLPAVETHPLTEQQLEQMSSERKLSASIEGLWSATDESGYRVGIVSTAPTRDFVAVIFESPRSYLWQPGMVKGRFTAAADGQAYAAKWRLADRTEATGIASVKDSILTISVSRAGQEETIRFLKLGAGGTGTNVSLATGTGFFCAPGIVATNAHVVEGAQSLKMHLPVQRRTVNLEVLVADPSNDLALLRVVGEDVGTLPPSLPLADASDVKLGAETVVVGFPLGDVLGTDHKVTSGVVSGLDGLSGDPRTLQLTAPIQPGSSGSPVFDRSGRVIGVVISTLNTVAAIRATGQVPQNVNFAVKSDYLALLLRRVATARTPQQVAGAGSLSVPELIERVRASVGQIRAYP